MSSLLVAQAGDIEARKQMIEGNTRLVWSIVQRFASRGVELEDLFQIGCIGLMKSVDKFDLSYDVKFSTYAVPMIIGEIQRFLRDDGMVKVSRSIRELNYKIRHATDELFKDKRKTTFYFRISRYARRIQKMKYLLRQMQ